MRRFAPLALALALAPGCDPEDGEEQEEAEGDDSMASCPDSEEAASFTLQNRTGAAITLLTMRACDGSELEDFPIPGMLADGDETTVELPKPACWILSYDAQGGCTNEPREQFSVCGGDTHLWTASSDRHKCSAGGW